VRFPSDSNLKDRGLGQPSPRSGDERPARPSGRPGDRPDRGPRNDQGRRYNNDVPGRRRDARPPGRPHPGSDSQYQARTEASRRELDSIESGPELASHKLDPFALFCAYYLGINADDTYRQANIQDVARRFGVSTGVIKQALYDYHMDPDTLLNCDFDLAMAQIDIQVSPPGVSKTELARGIFEEFQASKKGSRDWERQLAEDREANSRVF
jgi:hypothetical protein